MTRSRAIFVLGVGAAVCGLTACASDGFGRVRNPPPLTVEIDPGANTGTAAQPLVLQVGVPVPFRVVVKAFDASGALDRTFNRYVRLSSKPGAIEPVGVEGRNVLLVNGESAPVEVRITNAFGISYIVADDLGYVPSDPLRAPPPACSNGIDDDDDGTIDFPADEGCAFANDDSEAGGTFAEGVSRPIFFPLPRIADVRGLQCPASGCSGNGRTPYPREQIQLDTGWREDGSFAFDTVVTRISSDGFYVTDLGEQRGAVTTPLGQQRGAFASVFAFNFNAPPRMRVCDRLKTYGGTATEFFGFTQMSYPTWTLEEWVPSKRRCLVPDHERLTPTVIADRTELLKRSGSLVRVETLASAGPTKIQTAWVTRNFGPNNTPCRSGGGVADLPDRTKCDMEGGRYVFVAGPEASNCDFDKNGRIEFDPPNPESDCANACTADPNCTEWSNYAARSTFRITVTDSNGNAQPIQADATASAGFDPVTMKGKELRSFGGTLHFFSGGAQYTIEVRCKDDIVVDTKVVPLGADNPCTKPADCPEGFACTALTNPGAGSACRAPDRGRPDVLNPPPLACVFPRTLAENNPQ